jgi:exodeoxyribonuclease VII large subunit
MKPLRVSEVNNYIKRIIAGDIILSNLQIEGEISNFKHHYSGHMYFSLKDDRSKIKCVMFKGDNECLNKRLEEGMKVVATGYVSVYDREGDYQFYIRKIEEKGVGDLYKAFEDLKKKLQNEGLFDDSNKKKIPFLPKKIGVVTSSTGAAIRDIVSIIKRRYPPCKILIYHTLVQGSGASLEICKGLKYLDEEGDVDLIITGRGGGSFEELFAFNNEELARTIYSLKTPIISAVGHETDFTITDFVADLRAPTPSAAAELAVPDISYLYDNLNSKYNALISLMTKKINNSKNKLNMEERALKYNNPLIIIRDKKQEIDNIQKELNYSIDKILSKELKKLVLLENKLNIINPTLLLDKGYGVLYNKAGLLVKNLEELSINDELNILHKDGLIKTVIVELEKGGLPDGIK